MRQRSRSSPHTVFIVLDGLVAAMREAGLSTLSVDDLEAELAKLKVKVREAHDERRVR